MLHYVRLRTALIGGLLPHAELGSGGVARLPLTGAAALMFVIYQPRILRLVLHYVRLRTALIGSLLPHWHSTDSVSHVIVPVPLELVWPGQDHL